MTTQSLRLTLAAAFTALALAPVAAQADGPQQYRFGDSYYAISPAELADENRGR